MINHVFIHQAIHLQKNLSLFTGFGKFHFVFNQLYQPFAGRVWRKDKVLEVIHLIILLKKLEHVFYFLGYFGVAGKQRIIAVNMRGKLIVIAGCYVGIQLRFAVFHAGNKA